MALLLTETTLVEAIEATNIYRYPSDQIYFAKFCNNHGKIMVYNKSTKSIHSKYVFQKFWLLWQFVATVFCVIIVTKQ